MVATVTRLREAVSTVHYFEADGDHAKNDPRHRRTNHWYGRGVEVPGRHGPFKPRRLDEELSRRVAGTSTRLDRLRDDRHERCPGLDIAFSAPTTVSLEALIHAVPEVSARINRAHDEAVSGTFDLIEREPLEIRGRNPVIRPCPRIEGDGLAAAAFRHVASRNLHPQLHNADLTERMAGSDLSDLVVAGAEP